MLWYVRISDLRLFGEDIILQDKIALMRVIPRLRYLKHVGYVLI